MKVTLVSSADIDGGAARAANRLLVGLGDLGADASMLVGRKRSQQPNIHGPQGTMQKTAYVGKLTVDVLAASRALVHPGHEYSPALFPTGLRKSISAMKPDVVNVHWSHGLMQPYELSQIPCPSVLTLHDMWAFTGGCHYDSGCGQFANAEPCSQCPMLRRGRQWTAAWAARRKQRTYRAVRPVIVCPSHWMASEARRSGAMSDLRIEVIPNPLDLEQFRPHEKKMARDLLGLPQEIRLIGCSALSVESAPRKGLDLLLDALPLYAEQANNYSTALVVIGGSKGREIGPAGLEVFKLGHLADELSMALALSACDLIVVPSRQENLANAISESIACGCPVVAFEIGGNEDLIKPGVNGYLAKPYEPKDLADCILRCLRDDEHHADLSRNSREIAVETLEKSKVSKLYLTLFDEIGKGIDHH